MNEEKQDIIYIALAVAGIVVGTYFGGVLGYEEKQLVGMAVGGLAGGFVGFLVSLAISPLVLPSLFLFIFAGPIALGIVIFYYASNN